MASVTDAGPRPLRLAVYTDAVAWGGAEVVLGHLIRELGPHVTVAVVGVDAAIVRRLADARPGTAAVVLPPITGKLDLPGMWRHRAALARLRPDVVHLNLQIPAAARYAAAVAVTLPGVAVVAVEHLPMPIGSALARRLKRLTARRLAAHVAVGERAARQVEEIAGLPPGSVRVLRNGVPAPASTPAGRSDADTARPVVGTIARLDPQKGVDVLLLAAARIDATVVVAGSGPAEAALRRLADDLGVADRVSWSGWVDDPARLLATFDVFVLASRYEGFPLVVLEAMHAGVPVVATDVGSVAEAVADGRTGRLVPAGDPTALAAAVQELLADPACRAAMADAARRVAAEQFTATAMAGRYERLYEEVRAR